MDVATVLYDFDFSIGFVIQMSLAMKIKQHFQLHHLSSHTIFICKRFPRPPSMIFAKVDNSIPDLLFSILEI